MSISCIISMSKTWGASIFMHTSENFTYNDLDAVDKIFVEGEVSYTPQQALCILLAQSIMTAEH